MQPRQNELPRPGVPAALTVCPSGWEGIPLLLKEISRLWYGFVVGGTSRRPFAIREDEGRGEGVVCMGQRRKNPQPFGVVGFVIIFKVIFLNY